jgi:hypothetical protein
VLHILMLSHWRITIHLILTMKGVKYPIY